MAYIGQGLRSDLERLEGDTVSALIASLKRHGVSEAVISDHKKNPCLGKMTAIAYFLQIVSPS